MISHDYSNSTIEIQNFEVSASRPLPNPPSNSNKHPNQRTQPRNRTPNLRRRPHVPPRIRPLPWILPRRRMLLVDQPLHPEYLCEDDTSTCQQRQQRREGE